MRQYKETKYMICANGNIVNSKTGRCLKWQDNGNGYKKITLTISGKQIQRYVHRLVAELYCEKGKGRKQINHKDGNKSNNHYLNLEWVSNSENQVHAHETGLKLSGNRLLNGKFSKEDICQMRAMDASGVLRKDIANLFGCSKSTTSDILNGKRYLYFALTGNELKEK